MTPVNIRATRVTDLPHLAEIERSATRAFESIDQSESLGDASEAQLGLPLHLRCAMQWLPLSEIR